MLGAFSQQPILTSALLINAHLGVFLIARLSMTLFPDAAQHFNPIVCKAALFTAAYAALLGSIQRDPRRVLAILMVSHSSLIVAGLTSTRIEGVSGGLMHWMAVAVSTTGLISVYRSLEARLGDTLASAKFVGLANSFPRLAVFFAVSALALVGLPGTLAFCSEDLLLHGLLQTEPVWGVAVPIAVALNAVSAFRLFANLFLGAPAPQHATVDDALPRERYVLTALLLFLVSSGLTPGFILRMRASAAEAIAGAGQSHEASAGLQTKDFAAFP